MPMAPEAPDLSKTTLAGYELIAVKLTEASPAIRPLYRKFEQLEHRVLLHLQDEISVLEERLRPLDEVITQWSNVYEETAGKPSSRRQDLWHGTDLHHRRTMLLGEIYLKLEQYHRSLAAYTGVAKGLEPPSEDDIAKYSSWMSTNKPVIDEESSFLRHDKDLVALPQRPALPILLDQPIIRFLPFVLLMPLVAFTVVPGYLGRLFTSAIIVAAQWMALSSTEIRHALQFREWITAIIVYLLAMAVVAAIV